MLTLIVFLPLAACLVLLAMRHWDRDRAFRVAYGAVAATFVLSLVVLMGYDSGNGQMQFLNSAVWVPLLNIQYEVGVDGISLWLLVLTAFLSVLAVGAARGQERNFRQFLALLLLLETGTLGVFVALDTILFYVFWELMLIPTYFLIGIWGEGRRVYATTKFVIYTLVGSLLMLVAIVWITMVHYEATHELTFDIQTLVHTHMPADVQLWMFACFFLAFAIKVPIFPFHSWLPHTYVACPIPVLIMLTGAMSKTGAYGLIRFCLPLFPEMVQDFALYIGAMAAGGIVYGAWIAVAQRDLKALVAYSSISHLGFIVLGIFAINGNGVNGSILQMVNHGIIASALFLIVGMLESRMGTRNLDDFCGLKGRMPVLYALFMLITLAALGLPGLNSFVGEFLILMGVWTSQSLAGMAAIFVLMGGLAIVFAAVYMLYMFQGAMHEKTIKLPKDLKDIDRREQSLLIPACILAIFIGLFPGVFIDRMEPSVHSILHTEKTVNLPQHPDPHGGH
ncbi:MAG: NuoM family protein [Nitrospinaceae bacterium]